VHPPEFTEACNKAIWMVGVRLANVAMQWGHRDFPPDGGIGFRNELYKHPYCYLREVIHFTRPESKDVWTVLNRGKVFRLNAEHLIRIAGLSHFHIAARNLYLGKTRGDSPRRSSRQTALRIKRVWQFQPGGFIVLGA
jgi:hypothetical protein